MSQLSSNSMVDIIIIYHSIRNSTDTRDQYKYRKTIQFRKDSISNGFKLFTTIKERIIVELSSR